MKVYVDELPKDCIDCPCESEYYCNLLNEDVGYLEWGEIHKGCPLKTVADYTKQVREEVVEEIKKFAHSIFTRYEKRELDDVAYGEILCCNILIKKLGDVKRENNVQD